MNKVNEIRNEFKKIERTAAEVFSTYCALTRSLCNIYAILSDAEDADCAGTGCMANCRGKCGRCATRREAQITKDGLTVLLGAKAMGPMKKEAKPERLPDVPDWRDTEAAKKRDGAAQFAKDDKLTRIRLTVAAHQGDGLAEIIEAILADGTDLKTLASILGVNKARISEAKHGHARPGFVARFCEVLGEGADLAKGDPANNKTYKTYKTHKKNAVAKAAGRDHRSGKRGAR